MVKTMKAFLITFCLLFHFIFASRATPTSMPTVVSSSTLSKSSQSASSFIRSNHTLLLCFAANRYSDISQLDYMKNGIPFISATLRRHIAIHFTSTKIHVLSANDNCDNHNVPERSQFQSCKQHGTLHLVHHCHSLLSSKKASMLVSSKKTQVHKIILLFSDMPVDVIRKHSKSQLVINEPYGFAKQDLFHGAQGIDGQTISGNSINSFHQVSFIPLIRSTAIQFPPSVYHTWNEPAQHIAFQVHQMMFSNDSCFIGSCQLTIRADTNGHPLPKATVILHKRKLEYIRRKIKQALARLRTRHFLSAIPLASLGIFDPSASKEYNADVLRDTLEYFVFRNIGGRFVNGTSSAPLMNSAVEIKGPLFVRFYFRREMLTGFRMKTSDNVFSPCKSHQCAAKVWIASTNVIKRMAINKAINQLRKREGFKIVFIYRYLKSGAREEKMYGRMYWLVTFWFRKGYKSLGSDSDRR